MPMLNRSTVYKITYVKLTTTGTGEAGYPYAIFRLGLLPFTSTNKNDTIYIDVNDFILQQFLKNLSGIRVVDFDTSSWVGRDGIPRNSYKAKQIEGITSIHETGIDVTSIEEMEF